MTSVWSAVLGTGLDVLAVTLMVAGCGFFTAGTLGLLRFPDRRSRLHALTKADNLGLGLVVAGLCLVETSLGVTGKLVLIWALALVAAGVNGTLLAADSPAPRPTGTGTETRDGTRTEPDQPGEVST